MVIEDDRSKLVRANFVIAQAELKLNKEFEDSDVSIGGGEGRYVRSSVPLFILIYSYLLFI